jgi:hypothetical protein
MTYTLPSANHLPLNVKDEISKYKKAVTNFLKNKALMTTKEINQQFKIIDNDPFEFGNTDCIRFCQIWMPGKKFQLDRDRCAATMYEYVMLKRKMFF